MKPQLKGHDCVDHDPIEDWQPTDPTDVNYLLCLHIGPEGGQGSDLFYVHVLSEAVALQLAIDGVARHKKAIVIQHYAWSTVMSDVTQILDKVEGTSWTEIAQKLGQWLDWEFENYCPDQPNS